MIPAFLFALRCVLIYLGMMLGVAVILSPAMVHATPWLFLCSVPVGLLILTGSMAAIFLPAKDD